MEEINYEKMKEKAGNFAAFLIDVELDFSQQIGECNDGLAVYFDVEARNGKITIFFKDNGYVGIEIKEKND